MFGIQLRELVLATLIVAIALGGTVGDFYLPRPYNQIFWYAAALIAAALLIVHWFIRRRQRD